MEDGSLKMLVGTYTEGNDSRGVYLFSFEERSGEYTLLDTVMAGNPSFVVVSGDSHYAYSVGEYNDGRQCAYCYRLSENHIDLLCQQPLLGGDPCNIICHSGNVITSNYNGGTLSVFPTDGGMLLPLTSEFKFPLPSHIHCAVKSPDNRFLFVTDLGHDTLYRFDSDMNMSVAYQFETHSGPRHMIFSFDGCHAYLLHELGDLLTTFSYCDGSLCHINTISAYDGMGHGSADIHMSPDGRFLYTSHRLKNDGISIFKLEGGIPHKIGFRKTGIHPRNFALTPNGKYLLCACRDSNCIEIYPVDPNTGLLGDYVRSIRIPAPVCITFFR